MQLRLLASRARLLLFLAFALTTISAARAATASPVDVLVVADEATLAPLLAKLESPQPETRAAWTFWTGQLAGRTVALARSEGDPLNVVAVTTLALRAHPARLVFACGTARPHDPALRSGDIVVSERFVPFDGAVSPVTAVGGGSDALKWERLPHAPMTPGEKEKYTDAFPANATASHLALSLAAPHGRVLPGVLGSAHQINREADRIAFLRQQWGTSCEDAESAFVAGCAGLLGVPAVGARVIGDSPADAATFALTFLAAWK